MIIWAILVLLLLIGIVLIGTVIFLENRNPEKTVAWLLVLTVLPVIGFVIYLVLGRSARRRKLFRHKQICSSRIRAIVDQQKERLTDDRTSFGEGVDRKRRLIHLSLQNAMAPVSHNNHLRVLTNGDEKFTALFNALEGAKEHIHLEYYIFKDDEVGRDTRDLLIRKCREGVEVRVILDGLGSRTLPNAFLQAMRQAGVQVRWFFPVRFPFLTSKLNFRNHRKIVVVDGRVGFVGGMNIGDEYLSRNPTLGFWRDTHLQLEGQAVHLLQSVFLNDWYLCTYQQVESEKYFPTPAQVGEQLAQIVASGPDSDWQSIRELFFTAVSTAERSIYIETPYFVPDESITMALRTAALSGLDVRLIVQGIPEYQITYWASRSYFDDLLNAGVKIYKYQKGILHAKTVLVDGTVGIVGSANVDIRSFQLNFEISAVVYDRQFVERLEADFRQDVANSERVRQEEFTKRPLSDRLKESSARLLSPLL